MVKPTGLSPIKTDTLLSLTPEFSWDEVPGAISYTIQVTEYPNLILPVVNATVTGTTFTPIIDLPRRVDLWWRVRANGDNGPSAWSEVMKITSANPPSVPNLVAPGSNALLTNLTPVLEWSDSIILPGGAAFDYYLLQVAKDLQFTDMVEQQIPGRLNSYFGGNVLVPNTRYYWRVRAFNIKGEFSSWSKVRYFREAMLAPILSAPVNDAVELSLRPSFDWEDTNGAASYTIQVSKFSTMKYPILNKTTLGSFYDPTANLPKNTKLYWRVKANGPNGPSLWSEKRSFTITLPTILP